jgi:hypothetical protein
MSDNKTHTDVHDAVARLCADFLGKYWRTQYDCREFLILIPILARDKLAPISRSVHVRSRRDLTMRMRGAI